MHKGRYHNDEESLTTDYAKKIDDKTIQDYFLDNAIQADRKMFANQIILEEVDAIVMFYSSENINYL